MAAATTEGEAVEPSVVMSAPGNGIIDAATCVSSRPTPGVEFSEWMPRFLLVQFCLKPIYNLQKPHPRTDDALASSLQSEIPRPTLNMVGGITANKNYGQWYYDK